MWAWALLMEGDGSSLFLLCGACLGEILCVNLSTTMLLSV